MMLLLVVGAVCVYSEMSTAAARPNVVIILADDLGYADLSCYGGTAVKTPHLDAMAKSGIRFTDFHSSGPVCSPTRAGLLTGRYQQRAGVPGVINADPKVNRHHGLQHKEVTFAEVMKSAGYVTGMMGKWHGGYQTKYNPTTHGFDEYYGFVSGNIDYHAHLDRMGIRDWWHGDKLTQEKGYSTHLITKHAVSFIKRHQKKPFCLYIAHEVPHSPNQGPNDPPVRVEGRVGDKYPKGHDAKRAYREMIEEMDKGIGEVRAALKDAGVLDNTFVMFMSDNGGTKLGSNGVLHGYKGSLWEGGHRVAAIASMPGRIKGGQVSDAVGISIDLFPTMLSLTQVEKPAGLKFDGVDLSGVLFRGEALKERSLYWQFGRWAAVRKGDWKWVRQGGRKNEAGMLFDLKKDISERHNLAKTHEAIEKAMANQYAEWEADVMSTATKQPER